MDVPGQISDVDELETHYRAPGERAATKVRNRIDDASGRFLAHCRFLVLATTNGCGSIDASPRGGPAGFVQQLDDRHVAIPDLGGNNRLDSFRNIVVHPHAGALFVVPGKDETIRINGPAALTTDPGILGGFTSELRAPRLAVVLEVAELFGHCAKAFRRGGVWDDESWAAHVDAPDLAEIYSCQFEAVEADDLRRTIDALYTESLAHD